MPNKTPIRFSTIGPRVLPAGFGHPTGGRAILEEKFGNHPQPDGPVMNAVLAPDVGPVGNLFAFTERSTTGGVSSILVVCYRARQPKW
ncbi:MAG: hypothetical protein JOZ14_10210 [Acidobacteria bacterium]|nr:hypothetical protein [Acidobacteriota bacterium]